MHTHAIPPLRSDVTDQTGHLPRSGVCDLGMVGEGMAPLSQDLPLSLEFIVSTPSHPLEISGCKRVLFGPSFYTTWAFLVPLEKEKGSSSL